ncbi:hypothetical protein B566_EDAN001876 [Ephemera danica]|nr:hypothetical protein B566_EDAN001876 [Ephemera danica]
MFQNTESAQQLDYDIVVVHAENYEDVLNSLRRNFFLDGPLNSSLNLVASSEPGACPELEQFAISSLKQNLSLMALSRDHKDILGVAINSRGVPDDLKNLEQRARDCTNPKFKLILGLLVHVEQKSDMFRRFEVETTFETTILSVEKECRGKGIATELLRESLQLARRLGFPLFRIDCNSEFTARAVAKLGLHVVFTMRYDEYRPFSDQEAPLQPAAPHHDVRAMAMMLK